MQAHSQYDGDYLFQVHVLLNILFAMIPKTIHYCWFGGKALPRSARKCLASWHKFFPDYEIKEWSESNFDVNMIPYTAEAYRAKKYAFVSDFARFWVTYQYGGVYFDTDVEVIRPMDDIIAKGAFMGIEAKTSPEQTNTFVAPGLGIACEAGNDIWKRIVQVYEKFASFENNMTVCGIVTNVLQELNVIVTPEGGKFSGLTLYPADFFCPQAKIGAPICLTEHTRSIHHYDASWLPCYVRWRARIMTHLPLWLSSCIYKTRHH